MDLMDKVRNLAKSKNPDHSWLKMSDEEILKSAGLWEKDFFHQASRDIILPEYFCLVRMK